MNKSLKKLMFCLILSIATIIPISIKGFDKNLGEIRQVGDVAKYNSHTFFAFKQAINSKTAVFCAKFHLDSPAASGVSCTLDDFKNDQIKAGVAAIIDKAKAGNSSMTQNYYYAEIAINSFLYNYDGKDQNNKVSDNYNTADLLGKYYSYYTTARDAYNKVKNGVSVDIEEIEGDKNNTVNADSIRNITQKYKITCQNTDTCKLTVSHNAPSGVKITVNGKENKELDVKNGDEVTIQVSNLSGSENIQVDLALKGSMSYKVAARYKCGNYQPVTINKTENKSVSASDSTYFKVITYDLPEYPQVKVKKIDSNTQKALAGATIQLASKSGNDYKKLSNKTTNNNGEAVYNDIDDAGEYCIVETKAPDGYLLDNKYHCFKVNVANDNTVTVVKSDASDSAINISENLVTVSLTNKPNELKILKRDLSTEKPLAGATLRLTDENGNTIVHNGETLEWVSTTQPKTIVGLPYGTYYLKEVKAPSGYILISEPMVIEYDGSSEGAMTFTMDDKERFVDISKVDVSTKEELPGAHLQILDESGKVVTLNGEKLSWVSTDTSKKIKGLPAGTYYLEETLAPDKYKLMKEKIKFVIDEYGVVTVDGDISNDSVVIMTNEMTKVYISKKDLVSAQELPGARIQILNNEGYVVEEWTSTNQPHYIEGLPIGNYKIVETQVPDGYTATKESAEFTILEDGTITGETTMFNNKKVEVPNTLSGVSIISTIFGVLLIGSGIGIYIYMKKRNFNMK